MGPAHLLRSVSREVSIDESKEAKAQNTLLRETLLLPYKYGTI